MRNIREAGIRFNEILRELNKKHGGPATADFESTMLSDEIDLCNGATAISMLLDEMPDIDVNACNPYIKVGGLPYHDIRDMDKSMIHQRIENNVSLFTMALPYSTHDQVKKMVNVHGAVFTKEHWPCINAMIKRRLAFNHDLVDNINIPNTIKMFLKSGQRPDSIHEMWGFVQYICMENEDYLAQVLKLLLDYGFNPNSECTFGLVGYPLEFVVQNMTNEDVKMSKFQLIKMKHLIKAGADVHLSRRTITPYQKVMDSSDSVAKMKMMKWINEYSSTDKNHILTKKDK